METDNLNLTRNFFWIIEQKKITTEAQIYFGAFLAIVFFLSLFLHNFLFSFIIFFCSIFILMNRTSDNNFAMCSLEPEFLFYNNTITPWSEIQYYHIAQNVLGKIDPILIIKKKTLIDSIIYIPISKNVDLNKIHAIMHKLVKENKNHKIYFSDQVFIRFFL